MSSVPLAHRSILWVGRYVFFQINMKHAFSAPAKLEQGKQRTQQVSGVVSLEIVKGKLRTCEQYR